MAVEVSDWYDLDNMRNDLEQDYVLVNNLDSETAGYNDVASPFQPVGDYGGTEGTGDFFRGSFDGQGHFIRDLVIDFNADGVGLFGAVINSGSTVIKDLIVEGVVDDGSDDGYRTGAFGIISGGKVENVVTNVDVNQNSPNPNSMSGGFAGNTEDTILNCYSFGDVNGAGRTGGFSGRNSSLIDRCYSTGFVSSDTETARGFTKDEFNNGNVNDCYFDKDSAGTDYDNFATPLTTSEMQGSSASNNMTGFDFSNNWNEVLGSSPTASSDGYPILSSLSEDEQLKVQGIFVEPAYDIYIGGDQITSITIDGEEVKEVTIDGTSV